MNDRKNYSRELDSQVAQWLWFDNPPDCIDHHAVAIPSTWLRFIEARYYQLHPMDGKAITAL